MGALPERAAVGTGRRDYSQNGDAWNHFTHDSGPIEGACGARGEDGIAGIPDDHQHPLFLRWLCGMARIRSQSERLFGLTNAEGNHGEDVKK